MSERQRLSLRAELARKALHAATAVFPVALSFSWVSQTVLRTLLSAAAVVALVIEALRFLWPTFARVFEASVGNLLRGHERGKLTGATWLALSMAIVLWFAPLYAAIAGLWAAALGDASAAIVGRSVRAADTNASTQKTIAGSLAALIITAAGAWWLTPASPFVAVLLGAVAAIVERPRAPLDDNLRIALAVALAAVGLGLR